MTTDSHRPRSESHTQTNAADLLAATARTSVTPRHPHAPTELCDAGIGLYARALREGRVHLQEAAAAPCLTDLGLLRPDPDDTSGPAWLRPTAPAVALPRMLRTIEDDIARQRRRGADLATLFEPLMALDAGSAPTPAEQTITVLKGYEEIDGALGQAASRTTHELLTVQPGGNRSPLVLAAALPREQEMLSRGARMRTLYQHTSRHSSAVIAHYEQLEGDVQVRTLHEVTERLIIFDGEVAFIPANISRTDALEVRDPALLRFFLTTFERLWDMATPMWPRPAQQPAVKGVTTRQRAIARLLVEGLTDEKIGARLGMNVRTVRVHIAKLAATLGSANRAQLGYLIGESGILRPE